MNDRIPEGVTYDPEDMCFFNVSEQEYELGFLFFRRWIGRSAEFPTHDYSIH